MKKKIIITATVLFLILIMICFYIGNQRKWSNNLNDAVYDNNRETVKLLLKEKDKNVNFSGMGTSSFFITPLSIACWQSFVDVEIVDMLVKSGAKPKQEDYLGLVRDLNDTSYEKLNVLLNNYKNPNIKLQHSKTFFDYIANTDLEYYKIYEMSREEWEKYILKTYKLIYYNAKPFDKKSVLNSSLKEAKMKKNKPLIKFIESELAKLDNK